MNECTLPHSHSGCRFAERILAFVSINALFGLGRNFNLKTQLNWNESTLNCVELNNNTVKIYRRQQSYSAESEPTQNWLKLNDEMSKIRLFSYLKTPAEFHFPIYYRFICLYCIKLCLINKRDLTWLKISDLSIKLQSKQSRLGLTSFVMSYTTMAACAPL